MKMLRRELLRELNFEELDKAIFGNETWYNKNWDLYVMYGTGRKKPKLGGLNGDKATVDTLLEAVKDLGSDEMYDSMMREHE
jgi:hypothetical protein